MVIYGFGFAAVFFLFFLLYSHAWRLRDTLELNELERHFTQYERMNQFAMMCFGLLSAAIATLVPPRMAGIAGYLYAGIGLYHFFAGWYMSERGEKIMARMNAQAIPGLAASAPTPASKTQAAPQA